MTYSPWLFMQLGQLVKNCESKYAFLSYVAMEMWSKIVLYLWTGGLT